MVLGVLVRRTGSKRRNRRIFVGNAVRVVCGGVHGKTFKTPGIGDSLGERNQTDSRPEMLGDDVDFEFHRVKNGPRATVREPSDDVGKVGMEGEDGVEFDYEAGATIGRGDVDVGQGVRFLRAIDCRMEMVAIGVSSD